MFYTYSHLKQSRENDDIIRKIVILSGRHTLTIEILGKISAAESKYKDISKLHEALIERNFDISEATMYTEHDNLSAKISEHIAKLFDLTNITEGQTWIGNKKKSKKKEVK